MKHSMPKPLKTLLNKAEHRKAQSARLASLSREAFLRGDLKKAVSLRNKATRQSAWSNRYLLKAEPDLVDWNNAEAERWDR